MSLRISVCLPELSSNLFRIPNAENYTANGNSKEKRIVSQYVTHLYIPLKKLRVDTSHGSLDRLCNIWTAMTCEHSPRNLYPTHSHTPSLMMYDFPEVDAFTWYTSSSICRIDCVYMRFRAFFSVNSDIIHMYHTTNVSSRISVVFSAYSCTISAIISGLSRS